LQPSALIGRENEIQMLNVLLGGCEPVHIWVNFWNAVERNPWEKQLQS